jgi:hypothetical protein
MDAETVTHSRSPSLMNTTAPKVFEDSRLENIFVRRWDTRLFITGLLIGSTWLVAAAYEVPLLACACLVFVALIDAARIRSWRGLGSDVYEQLRLLRTNLAELVFLVVVALLIASAQVAFGKMGPALGLVSVTFILTHFLKHARNAANASPTHLKRRRLVVAVVSGVSLAAVTALFWDVSLSTWIALYAGPNLSSSPCLAITSNAGEASNPLQASIQQRAKFVDPAPDQFVRFTDRVAMLGEVPFVLPSLLVLYIFAQFVVARPRKRALLQTPLAAVIYAGSTSAMMKALLHRERPMSLGNPLIFTGPSLQWRSIEGFSKLDMSLPSGHVAVTLAVARCLHRMWLLDHSDCESAASPSVFGVVARTVLFYTIPFITAISRTCRCAHWASDTIVGATIGFAIAEILSAALASETTKRRIEDGSPSEMSVTIEPAAGAAAVSVEADPNRSADYL